MAPRADRGGGGCDAIDDELVLLMGDVERGRHISVNR